MDIDNLPTIWFFDIPILYDYYKKCFNFAQLDCHVLITFSRAQIKIVEIRNSF